MSDRTTLDDWLDQWEEFQDRGQAISLDRFIAEHCAGAPADVVHRFRDKVRLLESANAPIKAAGVGAGPTGDSSSLSTPGPSPHKSRFQPGQEPVPGYRLEAWLGGGGFGEVWKATSPGGFAVVLKFVRLEQHVGEIERRALETIKQVRHPHLLAVFGCWDIDGYLVIALELADRTLLDRLKEAQKANQPGIPRDELLEYMAEAAKGLDHLHSPRQLPDGKRSASFQHQDIKPANLLLSGGSLKVGDFSLVRSLEHTLTRHTGGQTYAYAAPEIFENKTSTQVDQYALAITYCELRIGRRPFAGDNSAQLMKAHLEKAPDLSTLPPEERPVVAKALAKKPQDRWPSCGAFVAALRQAARTPAAASFPGADPTSRISPSRRWPLVLTGVSVTLFLFGGFWLWSRVGENGDAPAVGVPSLPGTPRVIETRKAEPAARAKHYLCDMKEFGWMGGKPKVLKHDFVKDLRIKGESSPHALFTHPNTNGFARVKYHLDKQYREFVASVAVEDRANSGAGSESPLTFQVFGDGMLLWESKPVKLPREVQETRVDVSRFDVLELRVLCPGSSFCAHAVWVEPYLLK